MYVLYVVKHYNVTTYTITRMRVSCAPCRQVVGEHVDVKLPPEFKKAWDEACKTKSRSAKNLLFNKWLESGGDWGLFLNSIFFMALLNPGNHPMVHVTCCFKADSQRFQEPH